MRKESEVAVSSSLTHWYYLPPFLPLLATILPLIPFNAQCTTISVSLYHSHRGKHEITRDENQGNPFELITPESITLFTTDYNIINREQSRISLAYKDGQLLDRQNCFCLHHKSLMRLQVVKSCEGRCEMIKVENPEIFSLKMETLPRNSQSVQWPKPGEGWMKILVFLNVPKIANWSS